MSNIDPMVKVGALFARGAKPIEQFAGSFDAASRSSKFDLAAGETEKPDPKVTEFHAKSAPSAGRPPLFRR